MKLSSNKNKLGTLLITTLIALISINAFADTKLDKLQNEIRKNTRKLVGCSDYFYRDGERFERCYQAVKRAGDALKKLQQSKSDSIYYFKGITIYKEGAEEYFPNFRDTNSEGYIGFLDEDSTEVMFDRLLSLMNDYRKLESLFESAYVSKRNSDFYFPVWVYCDTTISFNDCTWGVSTLKVALREPELLEKVREKADSITVSDKYTDPYIGSSHLQVRYKRKVAAMRDELRQGLAKIK